MKKLKVYWAALSRPARTLLLLLIALVSSLLTYLILGSPPLTAESGFRRAEMAHMIGPSEILGNFHLGGYVFGTEKIIVAQSKEFNVIYRHPRQEIFVYPKASKPAIYLAAAHDSGTDIQLHMVFVDQYPEAVTAIASIKYSSSSNSKITATATREHDGLFYFYIKNENTLGYKQLKELHETFIRSDAENRRVIIKLYDKNGQCIATRSILPTSVNH